MDAKLWFCQSSFCAADAWVVTRAPEKADLWWLGPEAGVHIYVVAAVAPVCPLCGANLSEGVVIDQGSYADALAAEPAPTLI
jgi:hypothetical protein